MDPDVNEAGAGGRWWVRAVRGTGSWVVPWRGGPCRPAPRPARAAGPPARPRGERPRPWFRAAATPVTGAAGPPTPNLTGKLPVSVAALGARPGVGRAVSVPQVKPAPGAGGSPAAPSPAPRTASAASSPLTGRQSATRQAHVGHVPPGPLARGRSRGLVGCQRTAWRSVSGAGSVGRAWDPGVEAGRRDRLVDGVAGPRGRSLGLSAMSAVARTVAIVGQARRGDLELGGGQRPGVEPGERCSAGDRRAGRRMVSVLRVAGSAITIRPARPAWLLSQGIIVATAATWRSSGPWILPTWPPCLV
jgi:hypothetical protein